MRAYGRRTLALVVLAGSIAAGCKKAAPPQDESANAAPAAPAPAAFSVGNIDLGNQIGADKRVTSPSSSFKSTDTIYVSVATDGAAPSKTIAAKWTFQDGQTVKADSQTIAPTGPASTEFHIAKKSAWPVGKYKVEISVDGSPAGTKDFEIKK